MGIGLWKYAVARRRVAVDATSTWPRECIRLGKNAGSTSASHGFTAGYVSAMPPDSV